MDYTKMPTPSLATKHAEMKGSMPMQCDELPSASFCTFCCAAAVNIRHPGTIGSRHMARAVHAYRDPRRGEAASLASHQTSLSQFVLGAEGAEGAGHRLRLRDLCVVLALHHSLTGMASQRLPQNNGLWHQPDNHTAPDGLACRRTESPIDRGVVSPVPCRHVVPPLG